MLPSLLAAFLTRHPGINLQLEVGTSEQVWDLLAAHQADLVIAGRPPRGVDGALVRAVRPNELVVVAAPPMISSFEPGQATWLLREAGSGTRTTCEALLAGWEVDPPRLTLGSNGAVIAGAAAGLGVTLVSRDAVARHLACCTSLRAASGTHPDAPAGCRAIFTEPGDYGSGSGCQGRDCHRVAEEVTRRRRSSSMCFFFPRVFGQQEHEDEGRCQGDEAGP